MKYHIYINLIYGRSSSVSGRPVLPSCRPSLPHPCIGWAWSCCWSSILLGSGFRCTIWGSIQSLLFVCDLGLNPWPIGSRRWWFACPSHRHRLFFSSLWDWLLVFLLRRRAWWRWRCWDYLIIIYSLERYLWALSELMNGSCVLSLGLKDCRKAEMFLHHAPITYCRRLIIWAGSHWVQGCRWIWLCGVWRRAV